MKNRTTIAFALVVSAIALVAPLGHAGQPPANRELIAESSILAGLAPNALFPFVDSTPHHIGRAHIAITDATATCEAGAAAPSNVQILAGEAGVELVNVMTAATNTGIGSAAPLRRQIHGARPWISDGEIDGYVLTVCRRREGIRGVPWGRGATRDGTRARP